MAGWSGYSEGGQGSAERGPNTFTFAPPATPQAQGAQAVQARMGYQTVQSVGGVQEYKQAPDATAAAVFGFAEKLLEPSIKEMAARKYAEGMQRAASGEQLTDIVNSQPWYSKIFGPSSAVEGARQYNLDMQAAKFDAAVQEAMPTLRNKSPDEIPGYILEMGKKFQTGDPQVDVQLGMRLSKVLPNLVKQHTREFVKAQQEHASNARFEAAQMNATSLQTIAQNPMAEPDDVLMREQTLLQGYLLPTGVDPKSHEKFVFNSLASAAEAGQFHALGTLMKNGVMQYLQPEDRLKLERQVRTFKKQHASDARDSYAQDFARIFDRAKNDPSYGAANVMADYDALNSTYSKTSGNDEPLVSGTTRASTAQSALQAYWQRVRQGEALAAKEAEDLAKAGQTAEAAEATDAAIRASFKTNGFAGAKDSPSFKAKDVERVFLEDWNRTDENGNYDWSSRAQMLKHHGAYKGDGTGAVLPGAVKDELARLVNSSGQALNNNFIQVYGLFRSLTANAQDETGKAAAMAAFGSKEYAVMDTFRRETQGKDMTDAGVLAAAYAVAKDPLYNPTEKFSDKEMPIVDSFLEREARGKSGEWGGGVSLSGQEKGTWWKFGSTPTDLAPSAKALFKTALASHTKMLMSRGSTLEDALKVGATYAQGDVELLGGYAWSKQGREVGMLDTIKRTRPDKYVDKPMLAQAVNSIIAETHKANSPGELADVSIYMGMDSEDGKQNLIVNMRNKDGTMLMPVFISSDALVAQVEKNEAAKVKTKETGAYGPKLSSLPDPKMPAPSAPAEAWAEYRAYQRNKRSKKE